MVTIGIATNWQVGPRHIQEYTLDEKLVDLCDLGVIQTALLMPILLAIQPSSLFMPA